MKRFPYFVLFVLIFLLACGSIPGLNPTATPTLEPTLTPLPTKTPTPVPTATRNVYQARLLIAVFTPCFRPNKATLHSKPKVLYTDYANYTDKNG